MAVEMVVQFRVQDALGQRFLQLVEKPILGKHLLRIAPRQELVQRALLDRHSPPPAASLWPHTQDSRQSRSTSRRVCKHWRPPAASAFPLHLTIMSVTFFLLTSMT